MRLCYGVRWCHGRREEATDEGTSGLEVCVYSAFDPEAAKADC